MIYRNIYLERLLLHEKIAIIGLSVLLSACASETYITDVTSESYREDYQTPSVSKPIMSSESAVVEKDVEPNSC